MLSLGITGGIAGGKSTAARKLAAILNCPFSSADAIVSDLLESDADTRKQLTKAFGNRIYPQGRIDRAALREIIFSSANSRKLLESILHPKVRERWLENKENARKRNHAFFLVEIPLLFEVNAREELDHTAVIACDRQIQILRVRQTRRLDQEMAEKIINSQMPLAEKIELADHVIWNDGSLKQLNAQLQTLARELR
jgi:dephospho-CoA kinase